MRDNGYKSVKDALNLEGSGSHYHINGDVTRTLGSVELRSFYLFSNTGTRITVIGKPVEANEPNRTMISFNEENDPTKTHHVTVALNDTELRRLWEMLGEHLTKTAEMEAVQTR